MRLVLAATAALLLVTVPASAACSRSSLSAQADGPIVAELNYLLCLHNEQVEAINALNSNARADALDIQALRIEIEVLKARIEELEAR